MRLLIIDLWVKEKGEYPFFIFKNIEVFCSEEILV